jgi:hypothetical protein
VRVLPAKDLRPPFAQADASSAIRHAPISSTACYNTIGFVSQKHTRDQGPGTRDRGLGTGIPGPHSPIPSSGGIGPSEPPGLNRVFARFVPFITGLVLPQHTGDKHVTSEFQLGSFVPFSVWPRHLSRVAGLAPNRAGPAWHPAVRPTYHPAARGGPGQSMTGDSIVIGAHRLPETTEYANAPKVSCGNAEI